MTKTYYVGHCRYGINISYAGGNWDVEAFSNKEDRELFLKQNDYDGRQYTRKAITRKTVEAILGRENGNYRWIKEYQQVDGIRFAELQRTRIY